MFWVFPHQLPAPRLGFLHVKPSLSCCLPEGPCCVTLGWVAKEGQALQRHKKHGQDFCLLLVVHYCFSNLHHWAAATAGAGTHSSREQPLPTAQTKAGRRRGGSSTMALPKDRAQSDIQMWDWWHPAAESAGYDSQQHRSSLQTPVLMSPM